MLNHKKFLKDNRGAFLYCFNMKIDFPFIRGFQKCHQEGFRNIGSTGFYSASTMLEELCAK